MSNLVKGFDPFYAPDSKVLILGSFPSVKSRAQRFYYGNPQNAFWRIIATFFGEKTPSTVEEKKVLLSSRKIALWDVVAECEIVGSRDETIKNFKVANINSLLQNSSVACILVNGSKAFGIFEKNFGTLPVPFYKLPSTSPANTGRDDGEWYAALKRIFPE